MRIIERLVEIVSRLRSPEGCPWDREQTHRSLRSALVEECYEVIEAINREDDANLREELGDLLLHVVMHAQMANERGAFRLEDVAMAVCEKLVRRHPHVFAEAKVENVSEVLSQWEQIKRSERGESASHMDNLPSALPALLRAQKVQKRAARVGFDWRSSDGVFEKIREELEELRRAAGDESEREAELGDLLFSVVNLARHLEVDAELALHKATEKFISRFQAMEKSALQAQLPLTAWDAEQLEAAWQKAKHNEQPG